MTDTAILAYVQNTDNNLPTGSAMHIRFSTDYGATWTNEDTFTDGGAVTGFPTTEYTGQAVIVVAPNNDLLFLSWASEGNGTNKRVSTDGGKTWTDLVKLSISGLTELENGNCFATDQAFVYDGVIYVSCIRYFDAYKNILIKSTDNGATWSYVGTISGSVQSGEAGIEYIGNNTIIAIIRPTAVGQYNPAMRAYSYDMGATWTAPQFFNLDMSGAISGGRWHLWTRAHLQGTANWWTDPVMIMCGFIWNGSARINSLWVSQDSGVTWSNRMSLDTGNGTGGYGDVLYNANTGDYVAVMSRGPDAAAAIKQYDVTVDGI